MSAETILLALLLALSGPVGDGASAPSTAPPYGPVAALPAAPLPSDPAAPAPALPGSASSRGPRIEHCLVSVIQDIQVPAQEAGVLQSLTVSEGDQVTAGTLLAQI